MHIYVNLRILVIFLLILGCDQVEENLNSRSVLETQDSPSVDELNQAIRDIRQFNPQAVQEKKDMHDRMLAEFNLSSDQSKNKVLENYNLNLPARADHLIVRFSNSITKAGESVELAALDAQITHVLKSSPTVIIKLPVKKAKRSGTNGAVLAASAQLLASNPNIKYVHADNVVEALDSTPNDPDYSQLHGFENTGQTGGTADADIDLGRAWDISKGSRSVLVAVIDSGVDYKHPDLAANIWNNQGELGLDANKRNKKNNGIDDDNNGFIDDWNGWDFANNDNNPMDDFGHGTHVAGTIGAVGNNGTGVVGVNWQVSIVSLKNLNPSGGTISDSIRAIEYAVALGVKVVNISWGGGPYEETMVDAIRAARDKGVLFAISAGNSTCDNDLSNPFYPASYNLDNIIAVAATDKNDALASFSCFGQTSVDVAAPGVNILSTINDSRYGSVSGTSMAAPHVSGLAALIKSVAPNFSYSDIRNKILNTVDRIPALSTKVASGGRINAAAALLNLPSQPTPTPSPTPTLIPTPTPTPTPTPAAQTSDCPWRNPLNFHDVNNDREVTPLDVLVILNKLNSGEPRILTGAPGQFYDVNCNGQVDANDQLRVVNCLNNSNCVKAY